MKVKIVNRSDYPIPEYQSAGAAGVDLYANIDKEFELKSLERHLVPTGVSIELPEGYEAQTRPRSGLAHKHGISIVNAPGTVDSDYRGEIFINLVNLSNDTFVVRPGERIAQMVIVKHEIADFIEVDSLEDTERGSSGHGSTG